jgi:hypothetical protein
MSDNPATTGGEDRKRINVDQDCEVRKWAEKFAVTPAKLREAVDAVGDQASKVEQFLRGFKFEQYLRRIKFEQYLRGNDRKGPKRVR